MKELITGGRGGIGTAIAAHFDDPLILDLPEFDVGDPDAWPGTDLVLRRLVGGHANPDAWRPWRGYAAMHLWVNYLTTIGAMT